MISLVAFLAGPLLIAMIATAAAAQSPEPSPHAIDIPRWFKASFLHLREDVAEATRGGKRLMMYFGQDGCPYCRELMRVNFSQKDIVDKTRRHFDAVAINIWGDQEVQWIDGKTYTEKSLAAALRIQFTPTVLFFDEAGAIALRLNGYYPPHQFSTALDYVAGRHEARAPYAEYLAAAARAASSGKLHDEAFFLRTRDFSRTQQRGRPLAIVFEQKDCAACDELHASGLRDRRVLPLLPRLDVARVELFGRGAIVTPSGARSTESEWARQLQVAYTPSFVFFDAAGREVFRIEGYVRPFHLASALDYVISGAYAKEPSFQRYVQSRALRIRDAGGRAELW